MSDLPNYDYNAGLGEPTFQDFGHPWYSNTSLYSQSPEDFTADFRVDHQQYFDSNSRYHQPNEIPSNLHLHGFSSRYPALYQINQQNQMNHTNFVFWGHHSQSGPPHHWSSDTIPPDPRSGHGIYNPIPNVPPHAFDRAVWHTSGDPRVPPSYYNRAPPEYYLNDYPHPQSWFDNRRIEYLSYHERPFEHPDQHGSGRSRWSRESQEYQNFSETSNRDGQSSCTCQHHNCKKRSDCESSEKSSNTPKSKKVRNSMESGGKELRSDAGKIEESRENLTEKLKDLSDVVCDTNEKQSSESVSEVTNQLGRVKKITEKSKSPEIRILKKSFSQSLKKPKPEDNGDKGTDSLKSTKLRIKSNKIILDGDKFFSKYLNRDKSKTTTVKINKNLSNSIEKSHQKYYTSASKVKTLQKDCRFAPVAELYNLKTFVVSRKDEEERVDLIHLDYQTEAAQVSEAKVNNSEQAAFISETLVVDKNSTVPDAEIETCQKNAEITVKKEFLNNKKGCSVCSFCDQGVVEQWRTDDIRARLKTEDEEEKPYSLNSERICKDLISQSSNQESNEQEKVIASEQLIVDSNSGICRIDSVSSLAQRKLEKQAPPMQSENNDQKPVLLTAEKKDSILHKNESSKNPLSGLVIIPVNSEKTLPLNPPKILQPVTPTPVRVDPVKQAKACKKTFYKQDDDQKKMLQLDRLRQSFKCMGTDCTFSTNIEQEFAMHLKYHETEKSSDDVVDLGYLRCAYCLVDFESNDELVSHLKNEHTFCKYSCKHCNYRAVARSYVKHQTKICHPNENFQTIIVNAEQAQARPAVKRPDRETVIRPYICKNGCTQYFFLPRAFEVHFCKVHPNLNAHNCYHCNDVLPSANELIKHYQQHV